MNEIVSVDGNDRHGTAEWYLSDTVIKERNAHFLRIHNTTRLI